MPHERVLLKVSQRDYEAWEAAKPDDEPMEHWIRRAINFMLAAEVQGTKSVTLGRQRRLIREIERCVFCGKRLGTRDPRALYCGDLCRVTAWRSRKAAAANKAMDRES